MVQLHAALRGAVCLLRLVVLPLTLSVHSWGGERYSAPGSLPPALGRPRPWECGMACRRGAWQLGGPLLHCGTLRGGGDTGMADTDSARLARVNHEIRCASPLACFCACVLGSRKILVKSASHVLRPRAL